LPRLGGDKLLVGLTGGIGSGKSSVTALFEQLGVAVIDSDVLAREVVERGTPGLAAVVDKFSEEVLDSHGFLDRSKLRKIVFADDGKRRQLEALLHPLIRRETAKRLADAVGPYCIVCIPLLFETGQEKSVDRVLVVDTPKDLQLKRALERDGSPRATIEGILAAQLDRQERLKCADDVIDNGAKLSDLEPQVNALHQLYVELAASKDES